MAFPEDVRRMCFDLGEPDVIGTAAVTATLAFGRFFAQFSALEIAAVSSAPARLASPSYYSKRLWVKRSHHPSYISP